MNKAEFIDAVVAKTGLTKKNTKNTIEAALDVITESLKDGNSVTFVGFGTFTTAGRAARTANVPGTTRVVDVPATTVAKFKVGKQLKSDVAGK